MNLKFKLLTMTKLVKNENILALSHANTVFIMLMIGKKLTILGILIFMSRIEFLLD